MLKKTEYDKLIIQNNIPLAWTIKLSKYKGDFYYHFHNVPRISAHCTDVFSRCTGYLCVSKFVAGCICSEESSIGKQDPSRVKVLYNCIDTDHFSSDINNADSEFSRKSFGISEDEKVILYAGRISREKGIDILIKAIQYIEHDNIKILIVGSNLHNYDYIDEYQIELNKLTEKYKDKIIFTGYIPQEKIPAIYRMADVAVLPSMWDEPAGLTMIEAMACGIPVITTESGGIPEYVGDRAIILKRDDNIIVKAAKSIDTVLDDNNDIRISEGVSRIRNNFDSKMYFRRFIDNIN